MIRSVIATTEIYIKNCKERVEFHGNNANASKNWNNFLNISNLFLTGLLAFSLTIMTVVQATNIEITVVASLFSLCITCGNGLKDYFSFKSLEFKHLTSMDSYAELKTSFTTLLNDIEKHKFEERDFEKLCVKYESVFSKSHHQTVKPCRAFFCCFK